MKTIKLLFTVMALAVAAIANGVEKPKVNVLPVTVDRAIVSIENENPAQIELSIMTENGDLVYYKKTNEPIADYSQVYDFKNMEAGNYVLNLKVNETRVSNKFSVSSNGIIVGEKKMHFEPYFKYKENVLKLSFLNFDKEPLKLNFYDENGLVYQTELGRKFNIATGYDLSNLEKGTYKVVLSSHSNEYAYQLVK